MEVFCSTFTNCEYESFRVPVCEGYVTETEGRIITVEWSYMCVKQDIGHCIILRKQYSNRIGEDTEFEYTLSEIIEDKNRAIERCVELGNKKAEEREER